MYLTDIDTEVYCEIPECMEIYAVPADQLIFGEQEEEALEVEIDSHRPELTVLRKMGSSEGQTYCLRWNNHKSNLVEILDALIKMECYVDCTIVVDEQVQFKAHRVVLAANSPYFQAILQDIPMDHCSILFPGVKEFEMRALLEYMYTGEVNVTQGQIKRIMEIAEQLEVKGLYDMTDLKNKFESSKLEEQQQTPNPPPFPSLHHNNNRAVKPENADANSPVISTSNNVTSAAQSSSSPPYNTFKPYSNLYSRSPVHSAERPLWHISALDSPVSSHAGLLSRGVYDSVPDNNPLKRKKSLSINSMISDTPILRDRLAQSNAADSSQPLPLMPPTAAERREERGSTHSNGTEYSEKKMRIDKPDSPFTDRSFEDESMEQSNSFASDSRIASYVPQQNQKPEWKRYKQYTRSDILAAIECVKNGMSALQASRKFGVPSRTLYDKVKKMGITTGRPMNRTIRRSPSNGSSNPAPFPYGLSGTSHPYPDLPPQSHHLEDERSREREMRQLPPTMAPHALLGPNFLQQALDSPMHAMVLAAAAHSRANGLSTSPNNARSPSPNPLMRYMRPPSNELLAKEQHLREQEELEQELREREHEREIVRREREMSLRRQEEELQQQQQRGNGNEHEEVEDLSMARKGPIKLERPPSAERSPSPRPPSQPSHVRGVIVPPLSQVIQRLKEGRFDTSPPMPEFSENREITSKEPLESNQ